jgi:glycosyltransferase involved in cell wall biosynthesis
MVNVCTIIARNYLPFARVLAETFAEHHPDGHLTVAIIDDPHHVTREESFGIIHLDEIVPDVKELHHLAMIYGVTELATAVKPLVLRHLLELGCPHVLFLDPDIWVFSSLEDVVGLAEKHSIVLTPHTTKPVPRDGHKPNEEDLLTSGAYNLGFLGLGADSLEFLDWWWHRLRRNCLIDPGRGLFIDQRWMDFVPGYFSHYILREETVNVAYWNVFDRKIEMVDGAYLVGGRPLRLFHFSGFKPDVPYLLSKHQGELPRVLLSEERALSHLCSEYAERVKKAGYGLEDEYGWSSLPDGTPIDHRMRRIYREELDSAEAGKSPSPPDAFDANQPSALVDWLNQSLEGDGSVSRYLRTVWNGRGDLRTAFPEIDGPDAEGFRAWARQYGVVEECIPESLLPQTAQPARPRFPSGVLSPGVNLAGYFKAELGIGEGARLLLHILESAGIPVATISYDETSSRQEHPFEERGPRGAPFDVNILCINADTTRHFVRKVGRTLLNDRHTIGMWAWEIEDFPSALHDGFEFVDEVWAVSTFAAEAIRRFSPKPVYTLQHPITVPSVPNGVTRESLALPQGRFVFLFLFDLFSVIERKNPFAVIEAFSRAFDPGEGPCLVIKTINGQHRRIELERLRSAASQHPDVIVIDRYFGVEDKAALMSFSDCYVSLHRAEGFGLTLAEAMALGKPVIATRYSGNLDFMDDDNSYLVDCSTIPIMAAHDQPYLEGSVWAEPDVDLAASLMRRVVYLPNEARQKGRRAAEDVRVNHSPESRIPFVVERLDQIRRARGRAPDGVMNSDMSRSPTASDLVKNQITRSPEAFLPPSRFGWFGAAARKFILRVMRPYWWGRRSIDDAFVLALREQEQTHADEIAKLGTVLETRVRDLLGQIERSRKGHTTTTSIATLEQRIANLEREFNSRLASLESPPEAGS